MRVPSVIIVRPVLVRVRTKRIVGRVFTRSVGNNVVRVNAGMYVIRTSISSFVAPEVSVSSKLASDEDNKGSVVCWATYGCTVLGDVLDDGLVNREG